MNIGLVTMLGVAATAALVVPIVLRWRDGVGSAPFLLVLSPAAVIAPGLIVAASAFNVIQRFQRIAATGSSGGVSGVAGMMLPMTTALQAAVVVALVVMAVAMLLQFFEGPVDPDAPPPPEGAPVSRDAGWVEMLSPVALLPGAALCSMAARLPRVVLEAGQRLENAGSTPAPRPEELSALSAFISQQLLLMLAGGTAIAALAILLLGAHLFRTRPTLTTAGLNIGGWLMGFLTTGAMLWLLVHLRSEAAWIAAVR